MTTGKPKGHRGVRRKVRKIKGEWLQAVDSESTVSLWHWGFESHPLRYRMPAYMERCESGRIGAPGERVGAKSVPWVRIPPSPLQQVALRVLRLWTKGGRARWGGSGAL